MNEERDAMRPVGVEPGVKVESTGGKWGRIFGTWFVGGACGALLGLLNGIVSAPPSDPHYRHANEWYPIGVLAVMVLEGFIASFLAAALALSIRTPAGRTIAFKRAVTGAVLAIMLGWLIMLVGLLPFRSGLALNSFLQAVAVTVVLLVSWHTIRTAAPTPAPPAEIDWK